MLYITGIQALNIADSTECCGDWHTSAINWGSLNIVDSSDSLFKDWGIEYNKHIPDHEEYYNVANTLRAILDMLQDESFLGYLKGFRNDFICTDIYNDLFFSKVYMLKDLSHWSGINELMKREFMWSWDEFLKKDEFKI